MAEIIFINCFEVAPGREPAFFALWTEMDGYLRTKPGFRWRRLHHALDADARLSYVNVAGWDTAAQFAAAHDEVFDRLVADPGWQEFNPQPALYTVDREDIA